MFSQRPEPSAAADGSIDTRAVVVEARDLFKTYVLGRVRVPALRGVSLRIDRGEIVAIVGPSGCGKTTLLHCLSGLEDFDSGEVRLEGRSLAALSDGQKADHRARRVGFVFQSYNLLPVLNALENVELPLLLGGRSAGDARRQAVRALEVVGLENRLRHRPSELSGGQQQRVAIARALATDPAVIFADEPTGNLDSDSAEEVMSLIDRLNAENGQTFVLVTHAREVATHAGRVVRMRDGEIVADEAISRERRAATAPTGSDASSPKGSLFSKGLAPLRNLFGVSQDSLLWGIAVVVGVVVVGLTFVAWRNPLLPRLAWRNLPRRPGFAVLITLGLTIGTVILSSAFTTGDTMSQSVRTVVAGVLGSADEVAFIPADSQRSGWDLAQSIATGGLLTGVTGYFPTAQSEQINSLLDGDPHVAAIVPVIVDQVAVSSAGQSFAAKLNVMGVPPQDALTLRSSTQNGSARRIEDLGPDEVYINTEAAAALNVASGQNVHAYGFPLGADATWTVRDVTRLGDLGGGEATVFLPLDRLQPLESRPDQVNEVLIVNSGDAAQRLQNSWPVTVALRSAFMTDGTARRLYRALSSAPARDLLARAIASPDTSALLADKLRRLDSVLMQPDPAQSPEFKALATDPEVLSRLASRLGGAVTRGNTPFAAAAAGPTSFRIIDVQTVAQDQADRWGSAFTDLFVVLGAFSLFSGMLLIVLVFSLVALERRTELGISRALGARRRDVVLLLAIEGGLYSVISSLFGLAAGLALALGIIALAQGLVEQYGFHLEPVIQPTSIAASYGLGVILTFVAVTATAWRSSRFSIVTAIRDLPDPVGQAPGAGGLLMAVAPAVLGPLLVGFAVAHRLSLAYAIGVAVSIVGVALVARWVLLRLGLRGPERVVFTLAGVALIGWWMLPIALFPPVVEMSFLSGVTMLLGAVWVLAYNVGLLRRIRGRMPLWRLSTAYVASNRFRTGLTLTMFALVVLSLTVSAVLLTATRRAYADPEAVTGGWDIHATSNVPPRDLRTDLAAGGVVSPDEFSAIGVASPMRIEGLQLGTAAQARWAPVNVVAVDEGFVQGVRTPIVGGDGWARLLQPGTAIVGAGLLNGVPPALRIDAREGGDFRPTVLWLRDTRGPVERSVKVQVVGVTDARGPMGNVVIVNAATVASAGWPPPDSGGYYLSVPPGANARDLAAGLNVSFADLQANTIGDELRLVEGVRGLLNMILQGFMGVGLLAGVAALGTLSTRAVVERRRQIGVLRALGFSARAVGGGLLVESAVVALLGAALGVAVGLFVARNTVLFLSRLNPELTFGVPWDQIGLVVLVALAAALLMTVLPARAAGRLTPAESLREG